MLSTSDRATQVRGRRYSRAVLDDESRRVQFPGEPGALSDDDLLFSPKLRLQRASDIDLPAVEFAPRDECRAGPDNEIAHRNPTEINRGALAQFQVTCDLQLRFLDIAGNDDVLRHERHRFNDRPGLDVDRTHGLDIQGPLPVYDMVGRIQFVFALWANIIMNSSLYSKRVVTGETHKLMLVRHGRLSDARLVPGR